MTVEMMPFTPDAPVLTVDIDALLKVDTSNPQNLHSVGKVLARCADSVEHGRRLENLGWRSWNREHICCAADKTSSAAARLRNDDDIPSLSSSVDSDTDCDEAVDTEEHALDAIRPKIERQGSCASSRRDHINAEDVQNLVVSIVKGKPEITFAHRPPQKQPSALPSVERSGPTTTEPPCTPSKEEQEKVQRSTPESESKTKVVRGFKPTGSVAGTAPRSVPSAVQEPTSQPTTVKPVTSKPAVFFIGGSYSSSEQGWSPDNDRAVPAPLLKRNRMFKLGGSSEEDSFVKSGPAPKPSNGLLSAQKKQTSFSNHVMTRTIDNDAAIADDSETDYVDESAIDDDDDSSDWEDSIEDSGKSGIDDKTYFKRVDSKVNLASRPSLITRMVAQNDRAAKLGNAASQSTSASPRSRVAQGPSLGVSPNDSEEAPLMMKRGVRSSPLWSISEVPHTAAQPIMATASRSGLQPALSPGTTRRNILSTELTESLRRDILHQRKVSSSTVNAVRRRRHTKQYEKAHMNKSKNLNPENQYFQRDSSGGYHSKGW